MQFKAAMALLGCCTVVVHDAHPAAAAVVGEYGEYRRQLLASGGVGQLVRQRLRSVRAAAGTDEQHAEVVDRAPREEGEATIHRCDMQPESSAEREVVQTVIDLHAGEGREGEAVPLTLPVVFHVIHAGSPAQGKVAESYLDAQVAVLNQAYNGHACQSISGIGFYCPSTVPSSSITFKKHHVNYIYSTTWFTQCRTYENTISSQHNYDSRKFINVYVCQQPNSLGWTQFPWSGGGEGSTSQNVFINVRTLPGYQRTDGKGVTPCSWSCNYNKGYTLAHEMGHYFGLYHTFTPNKQCDGTDDMVDDTPFQSKPGSSCSSAQDSCTSKAGNDPIWSFMDYTQDSCMQMFSAGQVARIRNSIWTFRDELYNNAKPTTTAAPTTTTVTTKPPNPCRGRTKANFCSSRGNPSQVLNTCTCIQCAEGFRGNRCQLSCTNRKCPSGKYRSGICTNTVDQYTCRACPTGWYKLGSTVHATCNQQPSMSCGSGQYLKNAGSKEKINRCAQCPANSVSHDQNQATSCTTCQGPSWIPNNDRSECVADPCLGKDADSLCHGRGTLMTGTSLGSMVCKCACHERTGFHGTFCDIVSDGVCVGKSSNNFCNGRGQPLGLAGACSCTSCQAGYTGDRCQLPPCSGKTANNMCSGVGTPVVVASTCACKCPANHTGASCETDTSVVLNDPVLSGTDSLDNVGEMCRTVRGIRPIDGRGLCGAGIGDALQARAPAP